MPLGVNETGAALFPYVWGGENRHTRPQEAGRAPVSLGIQVWGLASAAL